MFAQNVGLVVVVVAVRASSLLQQTHPWGLGLYNILHLIFTVNAANVPQTQKRVAREESCKFPEAKWKCTWPLEGTEPRD